MNILAAMSRYLRELNQPVITDYELCVAIFAICRSGTYRKQKVDLSGVSLQWNAVRRSILEPLVDLGIIAPHRDFPEGRVYEIIGNYYQEAGDIACSVDPFAYLSHLSAIEFHGLTNRIARVLYVTTPPSREWSKFAAEKMERDCGGFLSDYLERRLPGLVKVTFEKIQKAGVTRYAAIHRGGFKKVEGRRLRVASIGRTFLDMLRKPDYCGGMSHVIEIYRASASHYKQLIVDELDRHGTSIEKARAGYLLEEFARVESEKINTWARNVQRGGSRKLDPTGPYREVYSERWCLSLNVG